MKSLDPARRSRTAIAATIAAFLLVAALDRARNPAEAGAAVRPDVVRIAGLLDVHDFRASMIDTFLLVGKRSIPFAVTAARRLTPSPEEGVGILMPMGPGAPRIRLIGPKRLLAPIRAAKPGTPIELLGNLDTGKRLFQVIESSLSPRETEERAPVNGASAPRG